MEIIVMWEGAGWYCLNDQFELVKVADAGSGYLTAAGMARWRNLKSPEYFETSPTADQQS